MGDFFRLHTQEGGAEGIDSHLIDPSDHRVFALNIIQVITNWTIDRKNSNSIQNGQLGLNECGQVGQDIREILMKPIPGSAHRSDGTRS